MDIVASTKARSADSRLVRVAARRMAAEYAPPNETGSASAVAREVSMCFFFQAEDGIRDLTVTGVQTCALPICERAERRNVLSPRPHEANQRQRLWNRQHVAPDRCNDQFAWHVMAESADRGQCERSEERL